MGPSLSRIPVQVLTVHVPAAAQLVRAYCAGTAVVRSCHEARSASGCTPTAMPPADVVARARATRASVWGLDTKLDPVGGGSGIRTALYPPLKATRACRTWGRAASNWAGVVAGPRPGHTYTHVGGTDAAVRVVNVESGVGLVVVVGAAPPSAAFARAKNTARTTIATPRSTRAAIAPAVALSMGAALLIRQRKMGVWGPTRTRARRHWQWALQNSARPAPQTVPARIL